ncbi:MAG: hypothetical protein IPH30_03640 [Betaproteobacteria bacterium]|nr:hypothetical protein [Betaproteobacteria bacterium]
MSAFEIAKITPMVREVFESAGDAWCATFEVAGTQGAWAQVMKGTLNVSCPLSTLPDLRELLGTLPKSGVESWEPNTSVIVTFASAPPQAVATAVDWLFAKFYGLGEYSVSCRLENLDG